MTPKELSEALALEQANMLTSTLAALTALHQQVQATRLQEAGIPSEPTKLVDRIIYTSQSLIMDTQSLLNQLQGTSNLLPPLVDPPTT